MAKRQGDDRPTKELSGKAGVKENKSMANSLVKGLAWTLGGGLAVGLGIKIGQTATPPAPPVEAIDFGPVLDRIEGVENRIVTVETKLKEPGPMIIPSVHELEERVHAQSSEVESLRAAIQRATETHDSRINDLGHAVSNLESKLPELIDQSIKPKFDEMHERVQREMQETASQTLEIFADRIQSRVVEKITSIESDLGRQSEAINDLRDYSLKTDQNLQRLLAGVENLADKINRKFDAPAEPQRTTPLARTGPVATVVQSPLMAEPRPAPATPPASAPTPAPPQAAPPPKAVNLEPTATQSAPAARVHDYASTIELGEAADVRPPREPFPIPRTFSGPEFESLLAKQSHGNGFRKAALAGSGLALTALVVGGIELSGVLHKPASAHTAAPAADKASGVPTVPSGTDSLDTKKLADQSELLDQARSFNQNKEYSKAEDIYRTILKSDPSNNEVKHLLASALFRQDKIEEATKVVHSISPDKDSGAQGNEPRQ